MTDEELFESFEGNTLNPAEFTHDKHVRLGWIYCDRYPLAEAISRFKSALTVMVIRTGAADKYHETITWFYMLLINERAMKSSYETSLDFLKDNQDLVKKGGNVLNSYYSKELLASDEARKHYLLPDFGVKVVA